MPKQTIQDVVPPRRSIRRIPLSDSRKITQREVDPDEIFKKRSKKNAPRKKIWLVLFVGVAVLVLITAFVFSGATVTIEPRQKVVDVDIEAIAKNSVSPGVGSSELTYETIAVGGAKTLYLQATGESKVEKKASGTIVVYNNYSSSPQRLIKNTRFETPTGLIYRIDKSAVVPGSRLENGKIIPGSVEVVVYADLPGPEYNISLTDFTVPGFKGTPRYEGFYARSKTTMTGGFVGNVPTAPEDKMKEAYASAESTLKQELEQKISSQKPDVFVWYPTAVLFESERQIPATAPGSMIALSVNATSTAVVFNKTILSSYIAEHSTTEYDKEPILINKINDLIFTSRFDVGNSVGDPLPFSLKGKATLIWQFDTAKLKRDLAGRAKKEMSSVIANYRGIAKASAIIRPLWKSNFPDNAAKIKINLVNNKAE